MQENSFPEDATWTNVCAPPVSLNVRVSTLCAVNGNVCGRGSIGH